MQKEQEENTMDSLLCLSFSTYSSNNLNDVVDQVTKENDNSITQNDTYQNDNDDFEFVAFRKSDDEIFFENLHGGEDFPIFNHDGEKRYSDATEISNSLRKLIISDEKSSSEENDLDAIPPETYCVWKPKSPMVSPMVSPMDSPMNSPIKCKKSNSTGSSSSRSSSKRWKFLRLLRRSKSDGKESLNFETPSLELKKKDKKENSKKISNVAGKKIPVTEKKIPAPVSAIEAFYLRKKEMRVKSYLPYKQGLIGFGVGFNGTIGSGFPLHV